MGRELQTNQRLPRDARPKHFADRQTRLLFYLAARTGVWNSRHIRYGNKQNPPLTLPGKHPH